MLLSEQVRKSGYGKKLLLEAEKLAKEKECDIIKLDTLSLVPNVNNALSASLIGEAKGLKSWHSRYMENAATPPIRISSEQLSTCAVCRIHGIGVYQVLLDKRLLLVRQCHVHHLPSMK